MPNIKILVIEDETHILHNILEILELEGFVAQGAVDGTEGIAKVQQFYPDLIVCDIMMPKMTGHEVLLNLQKNPDTATIPFVFLTALTDPVAMRNGMNMGADDYITKPFTSQELVKAIHARLKKHAIITDHYEEEMSELRTNITYALPHELRTPLAGIMGSADFLLMDYEHIERDTLKTIAEVLVRSSQRLQRLTENYLLYAQLELLPNYYEIEDPSEYARYPTAIVQEALQVLEVPAGREADLQIEMQDTPIMILHEGFSKIMQELIDNALKFSKPGTKVQIKGVIAPEQGNYMVTITDQGRGMTAAQIRNIGAYRQFNRRLFEQQGLGLGLVIAKMLAEKHGGSLEVESEVNKFTRIYVYLPLAPQVQAG